MRSADRVRRCLLLGVDRTYRGHHETDAFDSKQTLRVPRCTKLRSEVGSDGQTLVASIATHRDFISDSDLS
jgi:hypothetical protein